MTFQFIIEYVEDDLPYDFGCKDEDYESFETKTQRIRARTDLQALDKFTRMFPNYTVIGVR